MPISTIQNASLASGVPSRANMPAGSVLQVVQFYSTSTASTTSSSPVNISGFLASITPSSASSKILVTLSCFTSNAIASNYTWVGVVRSGNEIIKEMVSIYPNSFSLSGANVSSQNLDSPNTTSSVTYQLRLRNDPGGGTTAYIGRGSNGGTEVGATVITLMEIAG